MKYFSSRLLQDSTRELNVILHEIAEISESEISWRQLSTRLEEIQSALCTPNFHIEEFRLRIFLNSFLPNIRLFQRKRYVGNQKFTQIQMLLSILFNPQHTGEHPATILNDLEVIVMSMERSQGWWKTDFASDLRQAVELEWLPILVDNRFRSELSSSLLITGQERYS